MKPKTPPITAFQFLATMPAIEAATSESNLRQFAGVAYSGSPLRHGYWGSVIFDLSTTQAAATKTPILVDHDPGKRAGYAELSFADNRITIAAGTLLDNEHGRAIAAESDQGFPWQMSVYIDPARVDELQAGATTSVNGQTITGPVQIFRNAIIREVSFTPTGVDYATNAAAMSVATLQPETPDMTLEELQAENAALKASVDAATARAEQAETQLATQQKAARMSAITTLFSAIGREVTEQSAAPYLSMDDATFSAVSADMQSAKPAAPAHLFSQQATDGGETEAPKVAPLKFNDIYQARRV